MLVYMLSNVRIKLLQVVLISLSLLRTRSYRSVFRSSRKDVKPKLFRQQIFGLYFLAYLGWKLRFAKVGRWSGMS